MKREIFYTGATIFDGHKRHENSALHVVDDRISAIIPYKNIPGNSYICYLDGGLLVPGFVDLQVNGGGGVLLNDKPDLATIEKICAAHIKFGTTSLFTTLITDTPEKTKEAIFAATMATRKLTPGFAGLHLEGPHLSILKNGAHLPDLIRPMNDKDLQILIEAKKNMESLIITAACENISLDQIRCLDNAGLIVSLGHTNATYRESVNAVKAGVKLVTHLFNAMSPLSHREPGLVGAVLQEEQLFASLIADGYHVDPVSIKIAMRAKKGPGKIFLVTDAMSTIGTRIKSFNLNGRKIVRDSGKLILQDGTLAGSNFDLISAVDFLVEKVGIKLDEALRMASFYPARCIGMDKKYGCFIPNSKANMVHLNDKIQVNNVWINGICHTNDIFNYYSIKHV